MARVAVVTDTTHYMPRELVAELGLHEVSLYVTFEGETEREGDMDFERFYGRLTASDEMPSTSQPSVGDFLATYEPLLDDGEDIVSMHISAGLSGTFAAAGQARDELVDRGLDPARLIVLDSATTCAGLGMMAMAATSAARAGASVEAAAEAADAVRRDARCSSRSRRSSSCAAAAAWAARRPGSARR